MEWLDLRDVVSGMKRELRCLLRENIRLQVIHTSDAGYRVKAIRCDIEDLIRHMVLDARDAMLGGGELRILTGMVALDAEYARTHPRFPRVATRCLRSVTRATGQMRKASERSSARPSFARAGASDSPHAMMSSINSEGTSVSRGTPTKQ